MKTTDMDDSIRDFRNIVWPVLRPTMPGGRLTQVEASRDQIAADLDVTAGIDAYVAFDRAPTQTWASRIQWRQHRGRYAPWAKGRSPMTFTIRTRTAAGNTWTEMEKRLAALQDGGMMPDWTLHAYLERDGGPLENMAWVPTRQLYELIQAREEAHIPFKRKELPDGGEMAIVPWVDLDGFRWFRANKKLVQTGLF